MPLSRANPVLSEEKINELTQKSYDAVYGLVTGDWKVQDLIDDDPYLETDIRVIVGSTAAALGALLRRRFYPEG